MTGKAIVARDGTTIPDMQDQENNTVNFRAQNSSTDLNIFPAAGAAGGGDLKWGNQVNLKADFDSASTTAGMDINAMRQAFQIQKLLERDARGGTRYTEVIQAHFGVTSPDARLQRPEYLGGGSSPVNIHPVAQTTDTLETAAGDTPQGNLAGFGTAALHNHGFTKN